MVDFHAHGAHRETLFGRYDARCKGNARRASQFRLLVQRQRNTSLDAQNGLDSDLLEAEPEQNRTCQVHPSLSTSVPQHYVA